MDSQEVLGFSLFAFFVIVVALFYCICFASEKQKEREKDPGIPQDFWKEGRKNHPSKGFHSFLAFPSKIAS